MRQALKIIAIAGGVMLLLFGFGAYGLLSKFRQDKAGIEQRNRQRLAEVERIRALPELRGVWVHTAVQRAPFSDAEVAACLLVKSREIHYSGPTGGRSAGARDLPRFNEEDNVAVVQGPDMVLSIDGIAYPFTLDSLILSAPAGQGGSAVLSSHSHPAEAVRALRVRSALIAAHLDPTLGGRGPDIRLQEILFRSGDTIRFHGRIQDGRIVPLF